MATGQRKVQLGAALWAKVRRMAREDVRPLTYQVAYLCKLALQAPREPPAAPNPPGADLGDDPPRSGLTSIPLGVIADTASRIRVRVARTGESWSQAVRQLVRAGIAIEEFRAEVFRRAKNG